MDMNKKSLALSIVTVFICIAVAVICLVVMKCDWVSLVLSAIIVALAVYVCVFCYLVARDQRKLEAEKLAQENEANGEQVKADEETEQVIEVRVKKQKKNKNNAKEEKNDKE